MTDVIRVTKFNDVHIKLHCESSIAHELNEYFTFTVPGARFSPAYKNKMWDGKIRLFHLMRQTLYVGLLEKVKSFANDRGYRVTYDDLSDFGENVFPLAAAERELSEYINTLSYKFIVNKNVGFHNFGTYALF